MATELIFTKDKVFKIDLAKDGTRTDSEINYSELDVEFKNTQFIENDTPPQDAEVLSRTWKYVRKDGGPDLRYSGNRQLPILRYGELTLMVSKRYKVVFQFSNPATAEIFSNALRSYVQCYVNPRHKVFNDGKPNAKNQDMPKNNRQKSPYEILGVKPNSTIDEIIATYRKLAHENHPDKVASMAPEFRDLAEERMKIINSAYSELMKEHKK